MSYNDANNTTPSTTPYYMRHFEIFGKINSFLKNDPNVLDSKKVNYIFLKNRCIYM